MSGFGWYKLPGISGTHYGFFCSTHNANVKQKKTGKNGVRVKFRRQLFEI